MTALPWLWVVFTLLAATAQTFRNQPLPPIKQWGPPRLQAAAAAVAFADE